MKICLVTPSYPTKLDINSKKHIEGIMLFRQVKKLTERGHEFVIITLKRDKLPNIEIINNKIKVYRVPTIFMFPVIRYPVPNLLSFIRGVNKICKDEKVDLIEFYNHIYLTTLPIFFVKKFKIPVITDAVALPGVSWSYGNKVIDLVGYMYVQLIGKSILKRSDGILIQNSSLYEYLSKICVDTNKICALTRGVDTEHFRPNDRNENLRRELNIKEKDIVIMYVGRLDRVKGVEYLIESANRLILKYKNLKFVLIGDGSLRNEYEKLAEPIKNNVIFLGFRLDVNKLLDCADIFVLPSLSEGSSNVVLEAMASALPVIATKVGETPRIIIDEETGILIKPKDVDGLTNAIIKLIDNPLLGKEMGKAGRNRTKRYYTWDAVCKKLEKFYGEVVERNNRMEFW